MQYEWQALDYWYVEFSKPEGKSKEERDIQFSFL